MSLSLIGIIVAIVLAIIGGLWVALKIARANSAKAEVVAQAAKNEAHGAEAVIVQNAKTEQAVNTVKAKQAAVQAVEQAAVDAGKRDDFSGDSW